MSASAWRAARDTAPPVLAAVALVAGAIVRPSAPELASTIWFVALVAGGAPILVRTTVGLFRGRFAADVVAMLAIATAIALRQPFAGLVIVLMQSGGELLERYAAGRASRAVRALEDLAPRVAHIVRSNGAIDDTAAGAVVRGDLVLVRPGEMIPCDGVVTAGTTHLDESRITGEPLPRRVDAGATVQSGAVNLEGAIQLSATAAASESLYARIVELVRSAQAHRAPIQRVADRYAVWFTPVTLAVCALAWWFSGDPLRVLAVLVVATPCPLILAVPVAVISGISRAAARQVIVRTGGALERLAAIDVAVFDKTGTLTIGRPEVDRVATHAQWSESEMLALVGAVERGSGHLLARSTVAEVERRGLPARVARNVVETPGVGVTGHVDGHVVTIGAASYVAERQPEAREAIATARAEYQGLRAFVGIDGVLAGTIDYADRVRENVRAFVARLGALGIRRTMLLSGDHEASARSVAAALGIDEARGDLTPDDKVRIVSELLGAGHRVLMTGDGTNDAPALSTATVGVALAAHGGGVTAEAADVVLLSDDVTRVADAVAIGRRTMRVARQSIIAGLGLSSAAMVVAAFGYLPPAAGALLQEAIDVGVIVNALRAAGVD
jgi:heavy metal translocating P-type ATPase